MYSYDYDSSNRQYYVKITVLFFLYNGVFHIQQYCATNPDILDTLDACYISSSFLFVYFYVQSFFDKGSHIDDSNRDTIGNRMSVLEAHLLSLSKSFCLSRFLAKIESIKGIDVTWK